MTAYQSLKFRGIFCQLSLSEGGCILVSWADVKCWGWRINCQHLLFSSTETKIDLNGIFDIRSLEAFLSLQIEIIHQNFMENKKQKFEENSNKIHEPIKIDKHRLKSK